MRINKQSLKQTNPYLQDPKKYQKALSINVTSSSAIETEKEIELTYLVCPKNKSKPRKPIVVCEQCKHNKKCRDYQKYLTKKEKEEIAMAEANQNIPMFPIDSTNILALGYNANTRTLRIEFKKNVYYDYLGPSPEVFQMMMSAESTGKFFYANIKGKYEFNKIEKEDKK